MNHPRSSPAPRLATALLAALLSGTALAEKADRGMPLSVAADRQATVDLSKQVVVFSGNVVITKGSIEIRADRVEVREAPDGYRTAVAIGGPGKPATFRQKRDSVDEYIAGQADRLEYDDKGDVVRFIDNAVVRRLRGEAVGDEITGALITYDNTTEVFSVSGGASAGAEHGAPGGRVRAVLAPRPGTAAAAEAASQAASAPRGTAGDKR